MEIATFVLAVVGAVLAAASLAWQAATYVLAGGRVSVDLRIGALHAGGSGMVTTAPEDAGQAWEERLAAQGYTQPLAVVRVRNVGRMPVTIERWSLTCSRPTAASRNGSMLGAIAASRPQQLTELAPVTASVGPRLPHRLEAGSSETWALDGREVHNLARATLEVWQVPLVLIRGKVELGDGRTAFSPAALRFTATTSTSTDD